MFLQRAKEDGPILAIDLHGEEKDLYSGAGYHLVAGSDGASKAVKRVGGDMTHEEIESGDYSRYAREVIQPWLKAQDGADIYIGMMSCYQFCDPQPVEGASGFALISRLIWEEYSSE